MKKHDLDRVLLVFFLCTVLWHDVRFFSGRLRHSGRAALSHPDADRLTAILAPYKSAAPGPHSSTRAAHTRNYGSSPGSTRSHRHRRLSRRLRPGRRCVGAWRALHLTLRLSALLLPTTLLQFAHFSLVGFCSERDVDPAHTSEASVLFGLFQLLLRSAGMCSYSYQSNFLEASISRGDSLLSMPKTPMPEASTVVSYQILGPFSHQF